MLYLGYERAQDLIDPSMYKVRVEQLSDGVLQKFVDPREPADHIIRATWSTEAVVYEKRMNRFPMYHQTEPLERKVASFNNDSVNQHSIITSAALKTQLEKQCTAVVKHLQDGSEKRGMVVYRKWVIFFKIDMFNK
eukprot:gene24851-10510_t